MENNQSIVIDLALAVARHPAHRLAEPVSLALRRHEAVAIYGANGSGKTRLVQLLTGAQPLLTGTRRCAFVGPAATAVKTITFRNVYGTAEPHYYQQRWNKGDEAVFPTVKEVLTGGNTPKERLNDVITNIIAACRLTSLLDAAVNTLSSGELRRFHLAKVLTACPEVLVIDNPYIGLDVDARAGLDVLLEKLSRELTLVVVVSRRADIPAFVGRVVEMEDNALKKYPQCRMHPIGQSSGILSSIKAAMQDPKPAAQKSHRMALTLSHVNVAYDGRQILRDLSWTVNCGEHWALKGHNGSGKTTLLSLICADNPMAYACDISIFGRRRGSGESIWDIKKHIGYVSPELYGTYKKDLPAVDIVASGLHDTVGLYRRVTEEERQRSREWLDVFAAAHLAERPYLTLSSGEQRLILLVRAFVKSPLLLILDEPFHGLDDAHSHRARQIIDDYMAADACRTLIMVSHYDAEFPTCIDHYLTLQRP